MSAREEDPIAGELVQVGRDSLWEAIRSERWSHVIRDDEEHVFSALWRWVDRWRLRRRHRRRNAHDGRGCVLVVANFPVIEALEVARLLLSVDRPRSAVR